MYYLIRKYSKYSITIISNIKRSCRDNYNLKTDLKSALKFHSDHNYKLNENMIKNAIISMYIYMYAVLTVSKVPNVTANFNILRS